MRYRLLILCATLIWGSTFVIVKDMTDVLSPAWILVFRFTCAAVILAIVFAPKKRALYLERSHVACGLACGLALFLAYYTQTIGITDTSPGKNAFLTSTYCVIVPFMAWVSTRKPPTVYNLVAAGVCIVGIGFICLQNGLSIGFGDAMTLVCACFYALHITLVARFAQGRDIYVITIWQFAAVGVCSFACALLFGFDGGWEWIPDFAAVPAETWVGLAYLTIMATTLALLFQNVGQAHLPAASASLLLSTEAVFGVAFSVAFGAEELTLPIVVGFVLVFCAIIISEVLPEKLGHARR